MTGQKNSNHIVVLMNGEAHGITILRTDAVAMYNGLPRANAKRCNINSTSRNGVFEFLSATSERITVYENRKRYKETDKQLTGRI